MDKQLHVTKPHKRTVLFRYFVITIGLFIYTAAWSLFLIPSKIVGGGISGVSSVIYLINNDIPVGLSNLVLNAILIIISIKILGPRFGISSIYGVVGSALFFILQQQVLHWDTIMIPMAKELGPLLCAVIGGALSGTGIGIAFSMGGNSGGTDIVALMVTKYHNISPGRVILFIDIFIIASSLFIPDQVWINVVYGYIVMGVFAATLDFVVEGNKQSYQVMIFSQHNEEIADAITEIVKRGVTMLNGRGWYTKADMEVLIVVVRKYDKRAVMQIVKQIDPNAFISVTKVQGVFGKNFDTIKN